MKPVVEFTVAGSTVSLFPQKIGEEELTLYPHQLQMLDLWGTRDNLLLTTDTGSGKTAAALFPLVKDIPRPGRDNAIFIYPTNALIYNQAKSMIKTLSLLRVPDEQKPGKLRPVKVSVIPSVSKIQDPRLVSPAEADVQLFVINGETIDKLPHKRTKGQKLLEITQLKGKQSFYLTNPDTLYLLLAMRYSQSLRNVAGLGELSTIIIDEFHSYTGIELANLVYSLRYANELGMKYRKVFLSATPHADLSQLLDQLFQPETVPTVVADQPVGQRKIANDVRVKLYPHDRGDALLDNIQSIVSNLKDEGSLSPGSNRSAKSYEQQSTIPCVVILNSVVNAIELEERLRKMGLEVSSYRGLMGKDSRKLAGEIVVGTSAIELGIDFDCHHLIMEASDASSFLQRFGRVGRHQEGIAHILVPQNVFSAFNQFSNQRIDRTIFAEKIKAAYPIQASLSWFVSNIYGLSLAKILSSHLIDTINGYKYSSKEGLKNALSVEQQFLTKLKQDLGLSFSLQLFKLLESQAWFPKLKETIFFRSGYPSIIVHDVREQKKRPEDFRYEADLATLIRRGEPCELMAIEEGDKPVVKIESYAKYHQVFFSSSKSELKKEQLLVNSRDVGLYSIRESERFTLDKLLEEHVFIIVPRELDNYLDWRTPLFPFKDQVTTRLIAFDGDALICKALLKERKDNQ
ncbi:MAG: type I-D CRISPR-associated helicase Cas3' [Candidatus Heimdallarchaeota archaeon]|nr:type I-D CRISPR-associated helicase Cas3' [Candidatus Heimdallarchaeota archaeon]